MKIPYITALLVSSLGDYVSENIIKKASFKNGEMIYNGRSYHTILLPEIETLDIETTKSLTAFNKAGGKIIFIEKTPFKSPSYLHHLTLMFLRYITVSFSFITMVSKTPTP